MRPWKRVRRRVPQTLTGLERYSFHTEIFRYLRRRTPDRRSRGPACGDAPRTRYAKRRCGKGRIRLRVILMKMRRIASAPASGPSANGSQPLRGAEHGRTATKPNPCAPSGSDPHKWGPSSAVQCAPLMRGCAPDPVREAPVREGAHEAAIDIGETGRNASTPANGPSANGSQPPRTRYAKRRCGKGRTRLRSTLVKRGAMRLLPQTGLRLTGRSRTLEVRRAPHSTSAYDLFRSDSCTRLFQICGAAHTGEPDPEPDATAIATAAAIPRRFVRGCHLEPPREQAPEK
jgi:hypothetical protein